MRRLLQVYDALEKSDGWMAGTADITAVASEQQAELRRLVGNEGEAVAEQLQLVSALERDRRRLEQWLEPPSDTPAFASPSPATTSPLCPSAQVRLGTTQRGHTPDGMGRIQVHRPNS